MKDNDNINIHAVEADFFSIKFKLWSKLLTKYNWGPCVRFGSVWHSCTKTPLFASGTRLTRTFRFPRCFRLPPGPASTPFRIGARTDPSPSQPKLTRFPCAGTRVYIHKLLIQKGLFLKIDYFRRLHHRPHEAYISVSCFFQTAPALAPLRPSSCFPTIFYVNNLNEPFPVQLREIPIS